MAWTEQCKVAFEFGLRAKLKKGLKTAEAIRELSSESDMPYHTLRDWHYSRETPTTPANIGNDEEIEPIDEAVLCEICKENPPREGRYNCSSCDNKQDKKRAINEMHRVAGAVKSIRDKIKIEGSGNPKWRGKIPKAEYEEFIDVLIETIKVWEEVSNE